MWRFLAGVSKVSASKKIPLLMTTRQQRSVDLAMLMFVRRGEVGGGGGGGGVHVSCVCVELEDWASENLSGRVQLDGYSPKWRALRNFSFQPCIKVSFSIVCGEIYIYSFLCYLIRVKKSISHTPIGLYIARGLIQNF